MNMDYPPVKVTICDSCSREAKRPVLAGHRCHRLLHTMRDCIVTKNQLRQITSQQLSHTLAEHKKQLRQIKEESHD